MRNSGVRSQKSEGGRWHVADGMSGDWSASGSPTSHIPSTLCLFLASYFCLLTPAFAATHVTATYGLPANPAVMATVNGTPEYGLIFVERNEAVTWNAVEYGKTTIEGYLNASGQLNDGAGNLYLDVVPDSDASPGGSYYVVTVNIQGKVHSEIWIVPDQTTVDATLIRQTQTPGATGTTLFYQSVENAGTPLAQRQALNFSGTGVSCADDSALGRTDCTITAGSGGGSGGGTVTSFSAGGLAPLFAASVSNATTTPALTFSLSNAPADSWFGNATGASAAPAYNTSTIPVSLIPALNYQTPLSGYAAPSHEFLTGFTSPNTFAAAQPGFSDLSGSITAAQEPSTTVNSVTNDTNVTGSIATQALTLGWTGTLATSRGGTGAASLSAANIPVQSGVITTGDCVKWASGTSITDAGAACGSGGGGSGTVTTFSAGNLSPLFATSVTNASTTPALSFSLSNTSQHYFFGRQAAGSGAPSFLRPACGDLSDAAASCSTDATNASNISSGTLATSRGGTGASSLSAANIPVQSGTITTGDCVKWASGTSITDAGAACGTGSGGDTTKTHYVPLENCSPAESSNAGNSFWTVTGLTAWDAGHWEFVKNASGDIYCTVRIPHNVSATPNANIVLDTAINVTSGNVVLQTSDAAVGASGSVNPASLTSATAQTVTVPATAYNRFTTTFAVQSSVAADNLLIVKIHQNSTSTAAANLLLVGEYLKIDETL